VKGVSQVSEIQL